MNRRLAIAISLFFCMGAFLFAAAQEQHLKTHQNPESQSAQTSPSSEGEKRFQINCGRCHNAPEDISPREARAVVRQMRVRAMLTAEDEKLILQYLAP